MRETKFRAWDDDAELMFYSDRPPDDYFFEFKNGELRGFAIRPPMSSSDPMEPPEPYCNDFPVMQYIGLKDKNGKKINWWEEDILQPVDGSCRIGIIAYRECYAEYEIQDALEHRICSLQAAYIDGWQKIGNIHKNLGEQDEQTNNRPIARSDRSCQEDPRLDA
ncbi:unnamed protein product [marine sediment metagenome]|uniref:YopX protein domain-containing protein n=1 Tax=marine sediment metagenome TaxID=412755 RepID=X0X0J1_9ZZZZ